MMAVVCLKSLKAFIFPLLVASTRMNAANWIITKNISSTASQVNDAGVEWHSKEQKWIVIPSA